MTFTGTAAAPGKLVSITIVNDAGMTEKWERLATAYVTAQLAVLAKKTCPKGVTVDNVK